MICLTRLFTEHKERYLRDRERGQAAQELQELLMAVSGHAFANHHRKVTSARRMVT